MRPQNSCIMNVSQLVSVLSTKSTSAITIFGFPFISFFVHHFFHLLPVISPSLSQFCWLHGNVKVEFSFQPRFPNDACQHSVGGLEDQMHNRKIYINYYSQDTNFYCFYVFGRNFIPCWLVLSWRVWDSSRNRLISIVHILISIVF